MQEEMNMRVNEAGKKGDIAQVEDFSVWRMGDRYADRLDAFPIDQHFRGVKEIAGVDLEKPVSAQYDGHCGLCMGNWR
jgi:hypothetical protein